MADTDAARIGDVRALSQAIADWAVGFDPGATGDVVRPEDHGAGGVGGDDTTALNDMFSALLPSQRVWMPGNYGYTTVRHLPATAPGAIFLGGGVGTLTALDEFLSGIHVLGDGQQVIGLTRDSSDATGRGGDLDVHGFSFHGKGQRGENLKVNGGRGIGYFADGAEDYYWGNCETRNNHADGFHHTNGAKRGKVYDCTAIDCEDDAHAVVSYDPAFHAWSGGLVEDIEVRNFTAHLWNQPQGRGMAIVGGHKIDYGDFKIYGSDGAGLYLVAEDNASWHSLPLTEIRVHDGLLEQPNRGWSVDGTPQHAAILLGSEGDPSLDDVLVEGVTVLDGGTSMGTGGFSRVFRVIGDGTGTLTNVRADDIRVRGTIPERALTGTATGSITITGLDYGRRTTASRPPGNYVTAGTTYYDTTDNTYKHSNGTSWISPGGGGVDTTVLYEDTVGVWVYEDGSAASGPPDRSATNGRPIYTFHSLSDPRDPTDGVPTPANIGPYDEWHELAALPS